MTDLLQDAMFEATQLTQAGRVLDATALIQRALGEAFQFAEASVPSYHTKPDQTVIAGDVRVMDNKTARKMEPTPLLADPVSKTHGPRFISGRYTNQAGSRDYKLYLPSTFTDRQSARPLLVMLHGCGQDPDDFATGTRMNQLAEARGWVVLYPAQADAANFSGCWNWFDESDQQRDAGEPSIIADLTRQVMASHDIDPQRVYVAGLSAGGAMAATLAVTYPDLYAAVGVHSGLPYAAAHDMVAAVGAMRQGVERSGWISPQLAGRQLPTIVFHGDCDTTVHPANALQVIAQARGTQACMDLDPQIEQGRVPGGYGFTRTRYPQTAECAKVEFWLVHSAGHGWMGGDGLGTYAEPRGPDASREMLRFFAEHPKSAQ